MNKYFLTLMFLGFTVLGMAQDDVASRKAMFGVLGGLNLSSMTNAEDGDDFSTRVGLRAGAFVKFDLNNSLYLNLKAIYSMQGNKFTTQVSEFDDSQVEVVTYDVDGVLKMDYIEVPLTLEYKLNRFSFELGPQIGFNILAETELEGDGYDVTAPIDNEQSVVVGGVIGVNGYITDKFYASVTYERGFSDLYKGVRYNFGEYGTATVESDYKYSLFSLSLNYIIF
ncbi:outer membrane beta-barrel protein [Neptunitalea lumnitzerae]|uniref:Outer membrane protein beta-barrel domain-containing protein n=1 Tax=Neptunitalea lumnitzerae TaxID=2965509 RepID=A0ABQ5MMD0_9FLAO|nr:outer membrane beta-barrel protein [Neptunitalea sp. Y10]GLB50551.1 hypothetical protein Y10_29190 [Neptunitalea sp. Y10]